MPYMEINSKGIKDLDLRPGTIKLLEENRGEKLYNVHLSNDLSLTPKTQATKVKIDKWNSVNCTAKETKSLE